MEGGSSQNLRGSRRLYVQPNLQLPLPWVVAMSLGAFFASRQTYLCLKCWSIFLSLTTRRAAITIISHLQTLPQGLHSSNGPTEASMSPNLDPLFSQVDAAHPIPSPLNPVGSRDISPVGLIVTLL